MLTKFHIVYYSSRHCQCRRQSNVEEEIVEKVAARVFPATAKGTVPEKHRQEETRNDHGSHQEGTVSHSTPFVYVGEGEGRGAFPYPFANAFKRAWLTMRGGGCLHTFFSPSSVRRRSDCIKQGLSKYLHRTADLQSIPGYHAVKISC